MRKQRARETREIKELSYFGLMVEAKNHKQFKELDPNVCLHIDR